MKKYTKAPSVAGSIWFHPVISHTRVVQFVLNEQNIAKQDTLLDHSLRAGGNDNSHIFAFHFLLEKGSKKAQGKVVKPLMQRLTETFPEIADKKVRWTIATTIAIS